MNTVRVTRPPMDVGRGRTGELVRTVLLAGALCLLVLVLGFAVGRNERPPGTPGDATPPGVQIASVSAAIPSSLSTAATIEIQAPPPPKPVVTPESKPAASSQSVGSEPVHAHTPSAPVPARPVAPVTHPTPAPAPTPTHEHSSTGGTTGGGGSSKSGGTGAKPESSGSTSFENSG